MTAADNILFSFHFSETDVQMKCHANHCQKKKKKKKHKKKLLLQKELLKTRELYKYITSDVNIKGSIFLKNRHFIIQERFYNKFDIWINTIIKCGT